jgi:hypothetical protein
MLELKHYELQAWVLLNIVRRVYLSKATVKVPESCIAMGSAATGSKESMLRQWMVAS